MKIGIRRHAGNFVAQLAKLNAPWKRGRLTPATPGGKAALASEEIADGNSGGAGISRFPPGQLISLHQQVAREHRAKKSTVKDATGTKEIQRQELKRMIAILRFRKEHQDL